MITLTLLFINPDSAKESAKNGLLLAGNVIIPTLFPFLVCTLIIYKSRALNALPFPKKIKHLKDNFIIFLLSNLGGYPTGSKLINEKFENGEISNTDAELLLFCSINSGPAFSILAVGGGILKSYKLGIILYASQFLSSFLIFLIISRKFSQEISLINQKENSFVDIFVSSVSDSSYAMLNISGYIVVCSTFLGILKSCDIPDFFNKSVNYTLEISNAILTTNNVYILAIILSFASFSIIFQVLSISKAFSPSIFKIILSRLIHSYFSVTFTYIILKILELNVQTMGNISEKIIFADNSVVLTLLLLLTIIAFICSVDSKKYCGKISADIF